MKYPNDIFKAQNKKSTFSISAHFSKEDGEAPMRVFKEPFSRFKLTLIENGGSSASANLPVQKVEPVLQKSKALYNVSLSAATVQSTENDSVAFTYRFATGRLKGKSPAEVLREEGYEQGKSTLNTQYKWLKDNLEKYPGNQKGLDAIKAAASLSAEDLGSEKPAAAPVTILKEEVRPLVRNKREDGMCFCYGINIVYTPGKDYGVSICIENYYAPVVVREDGTMNVHSSQMDKTSLKRYVMNISLDNWIEAVSMMELSRNAFYFSNFNSAYKTANEEERKNRQAATQAPIPQTA